MKPKIYAACLASYNAGILHGKWIDADQNAKVIWEDIQKMLGESPESGAEEFAIHDYEGFGSYKVDEYDSIDDVVGVAEGIVEHGPVFAELVSDLGSLEEACSKMRNEYLGEWDSLADYVEDFYHASHSVPQDLAYYVDWESMGRDWERNGDIMGVEYEGRVHVFSGG